MDTPTKPRLGQEPTAASLRTTAATYERDAAAREGSAAAHKAALARLAANPDEMNRASLAADADTREAIRLREMARVLKSALPAAEARERKAGMTAERARIERDGARRAATWQSRYEFMAEKMAGLLAEMRADAQAVEEFNREAASVGLQTLWPAEYRLRQPRGGASFRSLAAEAVIPNFAPGTHKLWPPAR